VARQLELAELHEGQTGGIGHMARKRIRGLRPLQCQQGVLVQVVDGDVVRQRLAQRAEIVPFGRAVDHQIERLGPARDHQVIEHPALLVKQQRIALLAELERAEVDRQHGFDRRVEIGAGEDQLAHVRHIEQPRILASPVVLGNDPLVLDGHFVARKGHHPRAPRAVPGVQRQGLQRDVFQKIVGIVVAHSDNPRQNTAVRQRPSALPHNCPLCRVT